MPKVEWDEVNEAVEEDREVREEVEWGVENQRELTKAKKTLAASAGIPLVNLAGDVGIKPAALDFRMDDDDDIWDPWEEIDNWAEIDDDQGEF